MNNYIANASIASSNDESQKSELQKDTREDSQSNNEDFEMEEEERNQEINILAIGIEIDACRKKAAEKLIKVLENPEAKLDDIRKAQEEVANTKADSFVPPNLPAFQLRGGPVHQTNKAVHDSIAAFLNDFEVQLRAHNLDFDQHWERLFWLTCDKRQRVSFEKTRAGRGLKWKEVRQQLESEHGNPYHLWIKKHEVHCMLQKPGELVRAYAERFLDSVHATNLDSSNELVWLFTSKLLRPVREKAWQTLTQHYGLVVPKNIHQVIPLIVATSGEETDSLFQEERTTSGTKRYQEDNHKYTGSKRGRGEFRREQRGNNHNNRGSCPLHPKGRHSKDECHILKSITSMENKTFTPPAPRPAPLCHYCHKVLYFNGHKCPEFQLAKAKKPVFANRSTRTVNSEDALNSRIELDLSQLNLQAQGKHLNIHHLTALPHNDGSLYVPIIVQSSRVWALVDSGANASFISPDLVSSLSLPITKCSSKKQHIYLASENSLAEHLGTVENLSLSYMSCKLNHNFVVMSLALGTQMSIGTDLMPRLGMAITNLATTWDDQKSDSLSENTPDDVPEPNKSPAGTSEEQKQFTEAIEQSIRSNKLIPKTSFCTIPESIIHIDTPEGVTSYRRQYPLLVVYEPRIQETVNTWLADDEVQKIGKEYFTVRAVVAHRELAKGKYEYRVRWEGYEEKDDTWQTPESFSSPKPIADYWDRLANATLRSPHLHAKANAQDANAQYAYVQHDNVHDANARCYAQEANMVPSV
ncbi:hypothetical protein PHYBLDRAFT_165981 [Phycomyces blakesleeanus NRRL 1555(-)]|uniref:Chromo domain-containing protein n=1 Tax=Phycomyces blakesleeanus (strain ATCC 8743b / DSM 1359 / FGSC 10004 / NBRC 33097 / NRRL 1555) TaxID=763407 RepID=A0A162Q0C2_PHYB8|nr:hypothetical protein PHYBLDRAFT_165981 [Phycomyces blakesleeanus NRRL 1555(-)]OAD76006.1 hypothetical protein PHYBLDRAFT_165981 [Phycomyces blakesleeanus NRRL 1555(-)]|eukprot:XP_018294046.1 hypothetical protein PHYBLDRAFT_165981 [Phycomyces blakesleeanus NRRL 1555(-)]